MVELRSTNDLNNMIPSPYEGTEPIQPPSPALVKGIPMGAESDTDSSEEEDSREEWDKKEHGNWSRCPSPPLGVGPTWAEVHAAAQEQVLEKNTPTWEDIISKHVPRNNEDEDSDWDKQDAGPVESLFEDTAIAADTDMEDPMEESTVEMPPVPHLSEASVGPGSQDVVQIHAGKDDLD